jgi:Ca2+-dependent lipid-binding protein
LIAKSNPYVTISFGEQRAKTSVKWNTNSPKWSEELKLTNVSTSSASKTIEVRIYDKERLARKTLLGAVTISIDGVDLHPTESWFTLSGGEIGCSGDIHLHIVGKK